METRINQFQSQESTTTHAAKSAKQLDHKITANSINSNIINKSIPSHKHHNNNVIRKQQLPSKYMKTPSFRRHGLRCLTMTAGRTFFLRSGFPFLTVAITMSPTHADGNRLRRPLIPFTEIMYRFLAPVLSAQFTVAATGRPSDILNLLPADPPRPTTRKAPANPCYPLSFQFTMNKIQPIHGFPFHL